MTGGPTGGDAGTIGGGGPDGGGGNPDPGGGGGNPDPGGGGSVDMAGGGGNPPPMPITEYAPYFYTWGWGDNAYQFSSLMGMKGKSGPMAVTIAFVLSDGGCKATRDIQNNLADVKAYVAAGGHLKASFGGADGNYLEYACADSGSLAKALGDFVNETGVTDLDFDLEQGTKSSNGNLNTLRGNALKQLQQAHPTVRVAFTLPVDQNGLGQQSIDIVNAALKAGVKVSFINGMTMDYGGGTDLGKAPVQSVDATAKQIQNMIQGISLDDAYHMVGATAMIGRNDDGTTFSLANAQTLIDYAIKKKIGLVSFWAIQRDEKCNGGIDLNYCNGVNQSTFQFHDIFKTVN
jgi:chitinase